MLLDGTDKQVSSIAVLGDAQHLLTPARRSWESVFSVTVLVGDTVCWCRWAMSVNSVFAGGQEGRGRGICKKQKLWLIYYFVAMGLTEFLWDSLTSSLVDYL